ncbi:MAG: HAMP domain-containing histidine kinase [Ignavibacteriales bacterium]|nr:HAMP domain-containing histidine kinase [Ignavibacteriales bacterium]
MFKTIKSKFIVLSIILIIFSVGIPVWFLLSQVEKNFQDRSILMVETVIDLMIEGLNDSMMKGDEKNIQKIVEQISQNQSIEHIRIFNEEGTIKYTDDPKEIGKSINIISPGHVEENILKIDKREVYLDKHSNVYKAIQPIIIEERCQPCHGENKIISYLDVDTDLTKAEINFYTGSFHLIFLGTLLIFLLALVFYSMFNKYVNKPLNSFILALDAIEKGNLNMRLPAEGGDEFSILNYHYNRMAKELNDSREKIDEMHYEQLQRADKMVTLGELTASMAHDINNHSAIVMSRTDYLIYEADNNSNLKPYQDDLEVINNQIDKISKVTGNILKHSKKLSKTFAEFDLVIHVENIIDMLEPLIKKKKIYLIREIKLSKALVYGDPNQIEQVLLNLISNAVDALPNGGELKVIVQKNSEDKIQLIINDNGIGIEEESLDKIFSPFYTEKTSDKGTGLGLYIVQNICKNHNAEINCKSKINEGTTFTITFLGELKNA